MEKLVNVTNIKFNSKFTSTYLRNNRSSGQKSLRCFPDCCVKKGHEHFGFCGQSIISTVELRIPDSAVDEFNANEPLFLLQLRPTKEPQFSKYSILSEDIINSNVRSDTCKKGQLLRGEAKMISGRSENGFNDYVLHVEFNSRLSSWDYGWKSNRWSTDETHLVDVMVLVRGKDRHYIMVAKAESSSFTMVACKTCSKTTKIWDKDPNLYVANDDDDDGDAGNDPIIEKPKTGSAQNNVKKASIKKSPGSEVKNANRAESIVDELNNLTKRIIDGSPGDDSNDENDSDENNDSGNKSIKSSRRESRGSNNNSPTFNNDAPDDEKTRKKSKKLDASQNLNDFAGFNDRDNQYYYDNTEKIENLLKTVTGKFDESEIELLKKSLSNNEEIEQSSNTRKSGKTQKDDSDTETDTIPSKEDVKRRYIRHLVERARSIGTIMTVEYDVESKKSSKKKVKPSTTSSTPKKKKRRKNAEDDVDNFEDVDGDNIYARKYVSKRGKGSGDHDSDDDDDDDRIDDIELTEKEKEKFENFISLAMDNGFFDNGSIDDLVNILQPPQSSSSSTTTIDSLNLLSSVSSSIVNAEKYKFDKNKIIFSLGSGNIDYADPRHASDPIILPTMAH